LRRSQFDDDQVGALLSTEYSVLDAGLTPANAMEEIRLQAPSRETVYYSYVTDASGKLIGFVSLRDLITAAPDQTVAEIMKTDVISVPADEDQERAAQLIRDYDLLALPVVDAVGQLVGIVTHDDAIDIVEEEDTEDVERMAGVTGDTEAKGYMEESVGSQIARRGPIIMFLAVFFVVTGTVLAYFKRTLDEGPQAIVLLLPMVLATGGMVGTQASSLVIRAMTVGNLGSGVLRAVLWKELRISLALGVALGAIVFGEAWLFRETSDVYWSGHVWQTCSVLSLAMALHVLTAAVFGATIPLLAKAMRGDPANVSTPAVTALADLSGAAIYLIVATTLLEFPATAG
jgi:magnesium transporter